MQHAVSSGRGTGLLPGGLILVGVLLASPVARGQVAAGDGSTPPRRTDGQEASSGPGRPATTAPRPAAETPWSKGVPPARRAEALAAFREGNGYFERGQYADALKRYRRAVKSWDHPAIRYNMVVCEIHLDRPLRAFAHLKAALRFGVAPLGDKLHAQARIYGKLLDGRLAVLRVECLQQGARVTLDGRLLFVGPGQAREVLLPGKHAVVVSRPGHLTVTRAPFAIPGQETVVRVRLIPLTAAVRLERRWKRWWPWTLLGAGALVALSAIPVLVQARQDVRDYDAQVRSLCPTGCEPGELPGPVEALEPRSRRENIAALTMFGLGGAVLVAGVVLVVMNQPRPVQLGQNPTGPSKDDSALRITPTLGPGGGGLTLRLQF